MQMRPLHQGAEMSYKVMEEAQLEYLGVLEVVESHLCQEVTEVALTVKMVPGLLALAIPATIPTQVFPMAKAQARTARWDLGTSARLTTWYYVSVSLPEFIIANPL